MSKTLLTTNDVPQYIREIASRLRPIASYYAEDDIPGYTFALYGKWKVGYESQLRSDCDKLLAWCRRYYADAYAVSNHFWYTDVPAGSEIRGSKYHRRRAYDQGFRNHIKLVITDPVAHRFEKDGFYRKESAA